MDFHFRFHSSREDLLDANRVANRVGCFRRSLWIVGAMLGLLWMAGAVFGGGNDTSIWRIILGLAVAELVMRFILVPYLVRRRIADSNETLVDIDVTFDDNGVSVRRKDGLFELDWSKVQRVESSRGGVLTVMRNGNAH
jgi:hypothetical protein